MALGAIASAFRQVIGAFLVRALTVIAPRAAVAMAAAGAPLSYQSQVVDLRPADFGGFAADGSTGATLATPSADEEMALWDLTGYLPKAREYPKRDMAKVTGRVWHHTASAPGTTWRQVAEMHLDRGWPGIGYHLGVDYTGRIALLNDLDRVTNHTANANTPNVGCVLLGDYEKNKPTAEMLEGIAMVRLYLDRKGIVKETLHRDHKPTLCPGSKAVKYLRQ